jgi:hypothetical protein
MAPKLIRLDEREPVSKLPRTILAIHFPKSNESVTFTGLGPFNHDDEQDEDI